jgi:hypothetical protein
MARSSAQILAYTFWWGKTLVISCVKICVNHHELEVITQPICAHTMHSSFTYAHADSVRLGKVHEIVKHAKFVMTKFVTTNAILNCKFSLCTGAGDVISNLIG